MRTERVGAASRRPAAFLAALFGALIVLAVLKPWSTPTLAGPRGVAPSHGPVGAAAGSAAAGTLAGGTAATPTLLPTTDPVALRRQCRDPDFWRLVTIERSGPLQGRSLLPVTLVYATGPADPAIVPQTVRTGVLVALGYCVRSAVHVDIVAAEQAVAIWQQLPGGAPVRLNGSRVLDAELAAAGEVDLAPAGSTPSPAAGAANPTWPQGRYIFELPADSAGGTSGWFAFTFVSTAVSRSVP